MQIIVNLKAYRCDPLEVARAAHEVSEAGVVSVGVAAQPADIAAVAAKGATAWAQHVSATGHGSHTGSILAGSVAERGATGTLLNHSERRLTVANIDRAIELADAAGLVTCVCANTPRQIGAVANLGPDAVAIEPPELIGTGTPVSQADPDIVLDAIDAARKIDPSIDVYCGAGISSPEDIAAASDLGADGVLLASAVAKADDPGEALTELIDPLRA